MHPIEMHEVTDEFAKCWQAAGRHIQNQVQDGIHSWLRADLSPPFLEHLSFRLGNQLFFIRLEDVDGRLDLPGSEHGLLSIADGCQGYACLMPMKKKLFGGTWVPDRSGWGLIDARTHAPVDPTNFVTDEKIEMTPWELHDFAVQVVKGQLEKDGYELMSWQGNPEVDPAIWFVGETKRPEWVVVRAARFPDRDGQRPMNWSNIADGCARLSKIGHFASVAFVSTAQPFQSENEKPVPLWRGHGVHVRYEGLA